MKRERLVIVGSGGRAYREYAFATLARHYRVSAVLSAEPTWQAPYLESAAVADLVDAAAVADAVSSLSGTGILTWDETVLETTAQAAARLGLPHLSIDGAAACRDKYRARQRLGVIGQRGVRHALVRTVEDAADAAATIGYPIVLKPRALAGSVGVVRVDSARDLPAAFRLAAGSRFSTLPVGHGVLVEDLLDGLEISVDSVVADGSVECVHVARKRLGFHPFFEEVGHLVTDWHGEPWADAVVDTVVEAHRALGVNLGVTHAEVRLTSDGPRLVELNGRLGGDLIPLAAELATGIDLVLAAAEIALARVPDLTACRNQAAEVRFVYPPADCRVGRVDVTGAARVAGIVRAVALAEPGDVLRLPPVGAIPRLAALIAVGDGPGATTRALEASASAVVADISPVEQVSPAGGNDMAAAVASTRTSPTA